MRIVIAGASGLLGTALAQRLRSAGHEVVPVSRDPEILSRGGVFWDPDRKMLPGERLEGSEVVVSLAGARIAPARWTPAYKALISRSRVETTRFLCETLARLQHRPRALLSASAVGYYGNRDPHQELDEASPPGEGFLARLCVEWEAATEPARTSGIRTVLLRTGTVLTLRGGFLPPVVRLFRMGLGGRLGSGRQVLSWIALQDYVRAVEFLLHREDLHGPFNLTAPNPVTNAEFTSTLARVLRRPALFRVPAFALQLVFGREMAEEVFLSGQRVIPRRLVEAGFRFDLPELEGALRAVLAERS
ncbi:MAG: TIGR01777 family oxidoreductase [Armatimonadota bacterium]|nr:TIGR01777 family oxidoreductase [Armatimonadota bacterium]